MRSILITAMVLSLASAALAQTSATADLAIINAKVWTVDDTRPEAEAIAISGDRIVAVGSTTEVQALLTPGARVIDADGRRVLPGFQDNHTHFINAGREIGELDLKNAATHDEFGRLIAEYAKTKKPGEWITGGNWDHDKFPGGELPTAELVDRYCKDVPVFISRFDGHMAVANTLALKLGEVTAETTDPVGGSVVRKPGSMEPAGVLKDAAMSYVSRKIPNNTHEQLVEGARKAFAEARKLGVTTVQDMVSGEAQYQAYLALEHECGGRADGSVEECLDAAHLQHIVADAFGFDSVG